jgi:pimeloyl-ACP methyl ester carboxylesterase
MIQRYRAVVWTTVLLLVGISTRATGQTESDSPPVPPPGQLVELSGWRLHLHCTGEASDSQPTVILEAGAAGFSVDWSLVQPEVARFAHVCSYDRAGLGWSDLGPHPRTLAQIVWELRTLLQTAGVRPPYVLVGHSAGGILARLYAFTYLSDVVGMVLDESGHEGGVRVLRNGRLVRLVETATGQPIPPVKTSNPLRVSDIPTSVRSQIEAAAEQMAPRANEPPRDKLPRDAQRMRAWAFAKVKHWAANDNPFEGEELAALLSRWRASEHALGDMPLIVLSRGVPEHEGPDGHADEEEHARNQAELVGLSRNGKQIIARHSGHHILLDEPHLVVGAIREVLTANSRSDDGGAIDRAHPSGPLWSVMPGGSWPSKLPNRLVSLRLPCW